MWFEILLVLIFKFKKRPNIPEFGLYLYCLNIAVEKNFKSSNVKLIFW